MSTHRQQSDSAQKADWINYIGLMRVIVRARTGWRFKSLEWTR
jgi:hypothetical protein